MPSPKTSLTKQAARSTSPRSTSAKTTMASARAKAKADPTARAERGFKRLTKALPATRQDRVLKRLTINLPLEAYRAIEQEAAERGITMTEYLRKAVELMRMTSEPGTDVEITRNGKTTKVMFL